MTSLKYQGMFEESLRKYQKNLITYFEDTFKEKFQQDCWQSHLGEGMTATVSGELIEKAGINISFVQADSLPKAATEKRPELAHTPFEACGLSLIIHPKNPHLPTVHLNIRSLHCPEKKVRWFAGGYDMTPYLPYLEDSVLWHELSKNYCDQYHQDYYGLWAKKCDQYFYLPHRQEPRGIGGLFLDDFIHEENPEQTPELVLGLVDVFLEAYTSIIKKRKELEFSKEQREFQLWRRGRYVEFNLLYDRGTHFGLQSRGRVESILVSMPNLVSWKYQGESQFPILNNNLREHWQRVLQQREKFFENNEKKVLTIISG